MAARHSRSEETFRLNQFPSLQVAPFSKLKLSTWRISGKASRTRQKILHIEPCRAYFAMIYLQPVTHCDLLKDGSELPSRNYGQGSLCFVDLSEGADIRISTNFDGIGIEVPFALVEEIAERFPCLPVSPQLKRNMPDPITHKLALSLLPFLNEEDDPTSPAVPHIAAAICIQLIAERHLSPDTVH